MVGRFWCLRNDWFLERGKEFWLNKLGGFFYGKIAEKGSFYTIMESNRGEEREM
jgi:hypothetical protein